MFSCILGVRLGLMTFDQVCEKIAASLEMSRVVSKAVDPVARSFSMGRVSGLEEALRILQAGRAAGFKGAAQERTSAVGSEKKGYSDFYLVHAFSPQSSEK
jgi:hypothetical protein